MKKKMIVIAIMLMLILTAAQAEATVEDSGAALGDVSSSWTVPTSPTLPTYLPSPCSGDSGNLEVRIGFTGPQHEQDKWYTTPGKPLDFMVTVINNGMTEVEAQANIKPESCPFEWFSWTTTSLVIPAGVSRSAALQVLPDESATAGEYKFEVEASARCRSPGSSPAIFRVQAYDYASETSVSGSGQFQINKDLRSMNSGIKSNKNVLFSGSVDALVKNEYMVDKALGKNANFHEQDAVDNYNAVSLGDALVGTESFKSSAVFGGVGAKVKESYDVSQMEFKSQDLVLHQTGSLKKNAEFKTADNFTGYYLIDAKQIVPGKKSMKEFEEYFGSFEINRRILFRDATKSKEPCQEGDCLKAQSASLPIASSQIFASPCSSGSCNKFANALNAFTKSA
ncbi:MAG: hypothetical protein A4E49_02605 [Methanosaeta sp. PtaU1.Bin112]|nr:MAG: hypothetical protein A4E49_02605 [Methanosaeta sp. PtaU1.Bin112]